MGLKRTFWKTKLCLKRQIKKNSMFCVQCANNIVVSLESEQVKEKKNNI